MAASSVNDLKKQIFYEMMNIAGRVFIQVRYSDDVIIGTRGFLSEEKDKGIIIVLNNRMDFTWDEAGISADLVFGSMRQKCFFPIDEVVSIISPELKAQFSVSPDGQDRLQMAAGTDRRKKSGKGQKVIKVDFNKKK